MYCSFIYGRGLYMKYNIIDIISEDIDDSKIKEIINRKIYRIIEIMEFNNRL